MDNIRIYEGVVKRLAFKPVRSVIIKLASVVVEFEDGQIGEWKFDLALRLFLITLQHVQYRRLQEAPPDCIWIPLGHFQLLGWSTGDCAAFESDDMKMVIGFS